MYIGRFNGVKRPDHGTAADYLVHHGRPGSQPVDDQTSLVHASRHRGHLARRRGSTAQRT